MLTCYKTLGLLLFTWYYSFGQAKDSLLLNVQDYSVNDSITYSFSKPKFWDMIRYIPADLVAFSSFTVQKENLKWDALVLGPTVALLPYDQKIINDSEQLGERLGGWDEQAQYEKIGGVLNVIPKNIPSAIYYIGNGGTTILLSGIFYGIGKIGPVDYRALNTSSELIEVLLSVGVTTQALKRITGRESPIAATSSGGKWTPFPSLPAFQNHTPSYDAMPSGHMATYIATVVVIATNYPEIKWIKPVGYGLGAVIAFNMMSGKVHWASDYPIAFVIGYVMGKNVANRRILKKNNLRNSIDQKKTSFKMRYHYNQIHQTNLFGVAITF